MQQAFQGQVPRFDNIGVDYVLSVSEGVTNYIKDTFGFPEEKIYRVPDFIDPNIFNTEFGMETIDEIVENPNDDTDLTIEPVERPKEKKNIIAFMPRKGVEIQYGQFFALAQGQGLLAEWEIVPIINKTKKEVAEILKDAKVFVNFTTGEGFGLPALESLLCGCVFVGNSGLGGLEFLDDTTNAVINIPDIYNPYDWVTAIKSAIGFSKLPSSYAADLSKKLAEKYSYDNFTKAIKMSVKAIQDQPNTKEVVPEK